MVRHQLLVSVMTATRHRTGEPHVALGPIGHMWSQRVQRVHIAATCSELDPPVYVSGLWVNYVNADPLERCDPNIHVYKYGPIRLMWLTRVTVGPSWLVQHVYLAAPCADWDPKVRVLRFWVKYVNAGSTREVGPSRVHLYEVGPAARRS
jgi:hypothetical protein